MDDPLTYSIAYLAARGDAPWRWTDDGDVIAWGDGTTIAFREEVAFIQIGRASCRERVSLVV